MNEDRWKQVCDKRYGPQGYSSLSVSEKVWINIRALIDDVDNGGVLGYFFNPGADTFEDCRAALDELGAGEVKAQLDRIAALYGGRVPRDIEARNNIIHVWGDENDEIKNLLEEIENKLFPALEEELEKFLHRAGLVA